MKIICETENAEIHYTLNGAEPTKFDPAITSGGTIRISRNAVLKVRAWLGAEASPVVTEDYRITGAVSCGYQHGLALSVAGRVWSWGEQASGRLGNGSTAAADVIMPGRVLLPPGNFELGALIAAGYDHSLVVDQSRQTWAFGENASGQLGNNSTTDSALPVRVLRSATAGDFLGPVTGADAGQNFSLALLEGGSPVTWGSQSSGRLGNGVNSSSSRKYADPVENGSDPAYPDLTGIRQISAGHGHGLAREANASEVEAATGRVWVWGSNGSGQLGRGNTSPLTRAQPMLLNATTELTHALDVSGGGSHTAVVRWEANNSDLDGTVWSCGNQSDGRLGNGLTTAGDVTYPVKAIKVGGAPLTGIRQVSAGPSHTLALDADGHVWAWGDNSYGQLGDGTTTDNGHARLVLGANDTGTMEDIVMVTAGGESTNGRSMALAGDGTIWVWGRNNEGQLGNGQTAGATILPVAHAQNHVAEGAPGFASFTATPAAPPEEDCVVVAATPTHSGPLGLQHIERVEIYLNGEIQTTLGATDCHCEIDGLEPGVYHTYGLVFDQYDQMAMSSAAVVLVGVTVGIDGTDYLDGASTLLIPYREGEESVPAIVNLPSELAGLGTWSWTSVGGSTWAVLPVNDGVIDLPTGDPIELKYEYNGVVGWLGTVNFQLIPDSPQQDALTRFTLSNTGHAISTAKAPLGAWDLAGPGGTGSIELKKSAATGCYSIDLRIEVVPESEYEPAQYSYRIFSAFNLPQEMPKGGSPGGSQEAPRPFSVIPNGIETLPLPILQNPFPGDGRVTQEINPVQYGEPPYIVQIIPTPTPTPGGGFDFTADNSQVFAESSTTGYSSCSSCSSCITPQVSLQDTPVTLSLGGTDDYDSSDSEDTPDPENPTTPNNPADDRFEACDADGELTFDIPSLYDPSVSEIDNPGIAGIGLLAPRGAYDVTTDPVTDTITIIGQRRFVIEPWEERDDNKAFKVTGYADPSDNNSTYITMTVEKLIRDGVTTLEVVEVQGVGTAPRTHRFTKVSNPNPNITTRSAVLKSYNGTPATALAEHPHREIRREFTPTGPTTWNERRIAKESPTTGGAAVAVHDENLKFRKLSTGVSRVEEQNIDPDGRGLKTRNFYHESTQNSGGSTATSSIGAGRLKKRVSYNGDDLAATFSSGLQETTAPYAGNPQGTKTTVKAAHNSFADVGTALGITQPPGAIGILKTSDITSEGSGPSSAEPEGQLWTGSSIMTGQSGKVTDRNYLPRTDATAPGRISRIQERSGRLTTWEYDYGPGLEEWSGTDVWTEIMESGEPDNEADAVRKGERVTTVSRGCQRMLTEITEGFNDRESASVRLTSRHSGEDDFDPLDRITRIHYDGPESDDHETFTYSCCGLDTHTSRRGKISTYQHDSLGRVKKTTVKRSTNGPATIFDTLRTGTTVTRLRNDVLMSYEERNLAGELVLSQSADEDGVGGPETTTYGYSYSATGTETTANGPLGTVSKRHIYPDGKTRAVWGNAVADRFYEYTAGGDYHEVITEHLAASPSNGSDVTSDEWNTTAYDAEGRRVATWDAGSVGVNNAISKATWTYDPATGLLDSSTDAGGVATTYTYHGDGSLNEAVRDISNNRFRVSTRAYGYVSDDLSGGNVRGSRYEASYLGTASGIGGLSPVTTTWSRGDGYASRTTSAATGTTLSDETIPTTADRTAGSWTTTSIAADGTRTVATYTDGLLTTSSFKDSANVTVSWTAYAYDGIGRLLSSEDSRTGFTTHVSGGALQMTHSGNLLYSRDPGGRVTTFAYDALGRRVTTTLPDDTSTFTTYDAMGNVTATWGSQTYPQRYGYDEQGRMKTLDTWRNNPPAGDPALATGHDRTTWHYDLAGRLRAKEDALGRSTDYKYSPSGRLTSREWARLVPGTTSSERVTTDYEYDEGLLEQVNYNDATPDVVYAHDGYGRVQTVTQLGNSWTYGYNPANWLMNSETIAYDLNADGTAELQRVIQHDRFAQKGGRPQYLRVGPGANGSITSQEHSAGYYYDTAGRLDRISGSEMLPGPLGADFAYQFVQNSADLVGGMVSSYFTEQNSWDSTRDNLLTKTYRDTFDLSLTATVDYGLDALGRRISRTESVNVVGETDRYYGYNERGELIFDGSYPTAFIGTTPLPTSEHDRGYAYDGIGNRKLTSSGNPLPGEATTAQLGENFAASGGAAGATALNQYGQVKLPGIAPVAVVHDLDGNMTSGPLPEAPGESSTLEWDAENRLIETQTGASGPVVHYTYDPFGRRIAKSVSGGASELYIYDGWNLVVRYSGSGTALTSYFWGLDLSGSLQGAGGVGGLLAIQEKSGNGSAKAGKTICPQYDGNGNIIRLVESVYNSTSQTWETLTIASYAYDGFGNRLNPAASDIDGSGYAEEQEFGFSTKFRDAETGLIYYGYRYYDPVTGRWPSKDPIAEKGGLNLYAFVGNEAVGVYDLLGLAKPSLEEGSEDLKGLVDILQKQCECCLEGAEEEKCKREAADITRKIWWIWINHYGKSDPTSNPDAVGGHMCYTWARSFGDVVVDGGYQFFDMRNRVFQAKGEGGGIHMAIQIFVKPCTPEVGKDCGEGPSVDDGFFEDGLVHEDPAWPQRSDPPGESSNDPNKDYEETPINSKKLDMGGMGDEVEPHISPLPKVPTVTRP